MGVVGPAEVAPSFELKGHKDSVSEVFILNCYEGWCGITASRDGTARIWDGLARPRTPQLRQILPSNGSVVRSAEMSPNGQLAATASNDGLIRIWDAVTGHSRFSLHGHSRFVTACHFNKASSLLLSGSGDGSLRLWNATHGSCEQFMQGHASYISSCAFSSNDAFVLSSSVDQTVRTWDVETGVEQTCSKGHSDAVNFACWSSNDDVIFSCSRDKDVIAWDGASGAQILVMKGHIGPVNHIAPLHDGHTLLSGSSDGMIRLWDLRYGRNSVNVYKGHTAPVNYLSLCGDLLASASADKTVRVWRVSDGTQQEVLLGHRGSVNMCAIVPDEPQRGATGDGRGNGSPFASPLHLTSNQDSSITGPSYCRVLSVGTEGLCCLWDVRTPLGTEVPATGRKFGEISGIEPTTAGVTSTVLGLAESQVESKRHNATNVPPALIPTAESPSSPETHYTLGQSPSPTSKAVQGQVGGGWGETVDVEHDRDIIVSHKTNELSAADYRRFSLPDDPLKQRESGQIPPRQTVHPGQQANHLQVAASPAGQGDKNKLQHLKTLVEDGEKDKAEMTQEISKLISENEHLRERNQLLEKHVRDYADLKRQWDLRNTKWVQNHEEADLSATSSMEAALVKVPNTRIRHFLYERFRTMEEDLSIMRSRYAEEEEKSLTNQDKNDDMARRMRRLEDERTREKAVLQDQIKSLQEELKSSTSQLEETMEVVRQNEAKIQLKDDKLHALTKEKEEVSRAHENLRRSVGSHEAELRHVTSDHERTGERLGLVQEERDRLAEKVKQLEATVASLSEQVEAKSMRIAYLASTIRKYKEGFDRDLGRAQSVGLEVERHTDSMRLSHVSNRGDLPDVDDTSFPVSERLSVLRDRVAATRLASKASPPSRQGTDLAHRNSPERTQAAFRSRNDSPLRRSTSPSLRDQGIPYASPPASQLTPVSRRESPPRARDFGLSPSPQPRASSRFSPPRQVTWSR